jgi:ABC transporter substrate binding protein
MSLAGARTTLFNVEARFANGDFLNIPPLASELVTLRPDLIVATGSSETTALQAATRDIPIFFLQIVDPLSLGVVAPASPSRRKRQRNRRSQHYKLASFHSTAPGTNAARISVLQL